MRLRRRLVGSSDSATVEVVRSLARRVGVAEPVVDDGFDWSTALVAELADRGANLLLQLDGDRPCDRRVTVLLSGSLLEGEFIRREGATVGAALSEVLCAFALEWPD